MRRLILLLFCSAALAQSTTFTDTVDTDQPTASVSISQATQLSFTPGMHGNQTLTLAICMGAAAFPVKVDSSVRGSMPMPVASTCQHYGLSWVQASGGGYWLSSPLF